MSDLNNKISAVEAALEKQPPFCTGLVEIDEKSSTLFYKKEGNSAAFLSLASPEDHALQALTDACVPAKFGRGSQDVYDESYRKAKKMNTDDFVITFDPSSIVHAIGEFLLDGNGQADDLELELYQLNVYDKGSFFKAHRDTPRSRNMFASLVVVFPSTHNGGTLLLRHDTEQWTFDSADILSKTTTPSAAFIAFYSDIEHEVTLVESGYRVTITYNIYRGQPKSTSRPALIPTIQSNRSVDAALLRATAVNLLQDPKCLPDGGYFGFGLRFLYPAFGGAEFDLDDMLTWLKGSDAVINDVFTSLSLETSLQILTKLETGEPILLANADDLSEKYLVESLSSVLDGVTRVYEWRESTTDSAPVPHYHRNDPVIPVLWLSPATYYVEYDSMYMAYGNEASLSNIYGPVCLVVKVGPANKRETAGQGSE